MTTIEFTPSASAERYDFLDWLRVIAIFILLFYHTGMVFVGWDFHIQNAETLGSLRGPMDIAHRLRMPLLFVIAGVGLKFAMRNRSGNQIFRERTLRLFLPLVIGMLLIVPPQLYFERLYRGEWQGGYLDFLMQRVAQLEPYPKGNLSWHHLWFVMYLYVYVLLLLPLLLWWRGRPMLKPGLWIYSLGLPLGINEAILKPIFPESHNLVADWYTFNHYLLLTLYGFAMASTDDIWEWLAARRRHVLFATFTLIAAALQLRVLRLIPDTPLDAFIANLFTWFAILTMLAYGKVYLSTNNGFIRWARDASYPIYILHQTFIIALAYFVIQMSWTATSKFWVIVSSTLLLCVLTYEYLIRRFTIVRPLFGMRPMT